MIMGLSACLHLYVHFLLTVFIYSCQNLVGDKKSIWKNLPVISPEKHALLPFTKEIWSVS